MEHLRRRSTLHGPVIPQEAARSQVGDQRAQAEHPWRSHIGVIYAVIQATEVWAGDANVVAEVVREAAAGLV